MNYFNVQSFFTKKLQAELGVRHALNVAKEPLRMRNLVEVTKLEQALVHYLRVFYSTNHPHLAKLRLEDRISLRLHLERLDHLG